MGKYLDMIRQHTHGEPARPIEGRQETTAPIHSQVKAVTEAASPTPPLKPGWLVVYQDRGGALCGGCDDRAHGTVHACHWDDTAWMVHLTDGQRLPLSLIRSVGQTDHAGQIVAAWTVRGHGYNGQKKGATP